MNILFLDPPVWMTLKNESAFRWKPKNMIRSPGHVINLLEHFPNPGEHAEDDYAVYTVLESEKNRIDKIHLLVKPQPDEDDED